MGGGDGVISVAEAAGEDGNNNTGTGTCAGRGEVDMSNGGLPMQSWSLWWLVRTYLQSLGQVVCEIQTSKTLRNSKIVWQKYTTRGIRIRIVKTSM